MEVYRDDGPNKSTPEIQPWKFSTRVARRNMCVYEYRMWLAGLSQAMTLEVMSQPFSRFVLS
jgi:hypothetical protein